MTQHQSRASTPKNWPILRKKTKWIMRVNPGTHSLDKCINVNLLLKELLGYAKTSREVRRILNQSKVLIDKKIRKEPRFPVGIMDLVEIEKTKEIFRLILDENAKFKLIKVSKEDSSIKPCKIIGKKILKGKKTQINLYDSKNILSEDKKLKVGDTILLDVTSNKIIGHLKLEKNAHVLLVSGKHAGTTGTLKEIIAEKNMNKSRILLETKHGKIETLKEYAFVVDNKFVENGK